MVDRYCPQCNHILEKNREGAEGLHDKSSADWICMYCYHNPEGFDYVFYDSEVNIGDGS